MSEKSHWWQSRSRSPSRAKKLLPRIDQATGRVEIQIRELDGQISQHTKSERLLFEKIVHAQERHDNSRATIFANELVKMQRQRDILTSARLALENILMRLQTVSEYRRTVLEMPPVVSDLRNIQISISSALPDLGKDLGLVEMNLDNLEAKRDQGFRPAFDIGAGSQEAGKILEEAAMIAEHQKKNKFPDVPNNEPFQG